MQQVARPQKEGEGVVRSEAIHRLLDSKVVGATTEHVSDPVRTQDFRRFALYIRIKSTGVGTHVVQFTVEFLEPNEGQWHQYNQGPFASLYYEDTVTATERFDAFEGFVLGRSMRVRAKGTSTTGSLYFTVSVSVEFFN